MTSHSMDARDTLTLGVEEEFVLVDGQDPATAPRADSVLAQIRDSLDGRVEPEFFQTQVEINTAPHDKVSALRADLAEARQTIIEAAARLDLRVVASATPVVGGQPSVTPLPRYLTMARRYAGVLAALRSETCGCHIHVGPLSRDEAMRIGVSVRPWLPTLEALAANSPFAAGGDRGCASRRHFEFSHWPTVGPPPPVDAAGYERTARDLTDSGVIMDRKMIYWYARPSERWPTLEIRVADVNADLDVPILLAILVRGLAVTLRAEMRAGRSVPGPGDDERLRQDHHAAAQFGFESVGLDPLDGSMPTLLKDRLDGLLDFIHPGLEAAHDVETAEALMGSVLATGGGAARQRADFSVRRSLADVVDGLVERTATV